MNRIFTVCVIVLALVVGVGLFLVAHPSAEVAAAWQAAAQPMVRGISVQMAVTNHATPMPEADNEDAWVVAVTSDGRVYFGTHLVSFEELADHMKRTPRNRAAKLYIKADVRAPFSSVERVLEIGREMMFETPVLLTSQRETAEVGKIVAPEGLAVLVDGPARPDSIVVQLSGTGQPLKVNGSEVAKDALQDSLRQRLQNRGEKVVVLKAAGRVPFIEVARVIDVARSTGSTVDIPIPQI